LAGWRISLVMRRDLNSEVEALGRALFEAPVTLRDPTQVEEQTRELWMEMELRLGARAPKQGDYLPIAAERRRRFGRSGRGLGWKARAILASAGIATAVLLLMQGVGSDRATKLAAVKTFATTVGQRANITLDDGTVVTLGPMSHLHVPADFGISERRVVLDGEGYFNVRESARAPYIVQTGRVMTHVLGTEFTVHRYPGELTTRVVVVSGRVASHGVTSHITLGANTVGFITDSTANSAPVDNVSRYTEWKRGRLVFTETPLPQMLATLGRWYGYEFRLADSSLTRRVFTSEFRADALDETLWILKDELNVTVQMNGKVITLRKDVHPPGRERMRERRELLPQSREAGR
jgi:transmembrane sensor